MLNTVQIIAVVITGISFIDFLVFFGLFLTFVINVTINAKKLSVKITSVFVIIFFIIFKLLHIPVFLSTVYVFSFTIPYSNVMLGFLTWSNILLAAVPLFFGVYTGLIKAKPNVNNFNFNDTIFICMPIYNEKPEALWMAIQSVFKLKYNKKKLHLFLSFDDSGTPEAFLFLLRKWNLTHCIDKPLINIIDNNLTISIIRSKHGGKKSAQHAAYKVIKTYYHDFNNSFIFYIDSDIILDQFALGHFMLHMKTYDNTALTGMITCLSKGKKSFLTYYQDIEYISGQILTRNLENTFNSSTCLPGALTILKWASFEGIADEYFKIVEYKNEFEYHQLYLGEDRLMTHMLMSNDEKLGFCQYAKCKTEAPDTLLGLLKQRRRWFLGHISNDVWMMSSPDIWYKYPLLSIFNFLNNTRNTSIYVYLLYFVLLINKNVSLLMWLLFIVLPMALLWLFISIYAIKINRKMNIIFYPMILLLQPIFSMLYTYNTIYTFRQKSWGGSRIQNDPIQNV